MQSNLHVESLGYLHAVRVHYFNLLQFQHDWILLFRSVPLNIIIGVDNYTLRNGTERNKVNKCKKHKHFLYSKINQKTCNCSRGPFLIDNTP